MLLNSCSPDVWSAANAACENAAESLSALKPAPDQQWLLVTSASHMPRAVACFRAVGFKVVPFPVDYRTRGSDEYRRPIPSIALGLEATDLAAHEWLGLATYRFTGLTKELFPPP
ncbi:MAG: YdcF family protein [Hyphomicrobium denitrificans]|nr:YdcF family protein [Hyphomicrobium denitrificans]